MYFQNISFLVKLHITIAFNYKIRRWFEPTLLSLIQNLQTIAKIVSFKAPPGLKVKVTSSTC